MALPNFNTRTAWQAAIARRITWTMAHVVTCYPADPALIIIFINHCTAILRQDNLDYHSVQHMLSPVTLLTLLSSSSLLMI
jgi:hypothetical protein